MKRLLCACIVILLFTITGNAYSQTTTPPEFPGGKKAFSTFLQKNLKWPDPTMDAEGTVIISFFVEKDGSLTNIAIVRGLRAPFDKEALRVIRLSPKWVPAFKNNKPIKSKYTVPIKFFTSE